MQVGKGTLSSLMMPHPLLHHTAKIPIQLSTSGRKASNSLLAPHCRTNTYCQPVLDRFNPAREPAEAHVAGTTYFSFWAGVLFLLFARKKQSFHLQAP